jgi:hypothetical protein
MGASASLTSKRAPLATARSTKSCIAGNVPPQAWVVRRTGQRIQSVVMLSFDPKRFATGCQNVHLWCYRFDEMLTRIEDQENSLVA